MWWRLQLRVKFWLISRNLHYHIHFFYGDFERFSSTRLEQHWTLWTFLNHRSARQCFVRIFRNVGEERKAVVDCKSTLLFSWCPSRLLISLVSGLTSTFLHFCVSVAILTLEWLPKMSCSLDMQIISRKVHVGQYDHQLARPELAHVHPIEELRMLPSLRPLCSHAFTTTY